MLTIDPVSLGTLTFFLAEVDAADLAKSEASDAPVTAAAGCCFTSTMEIEGNER